MEVFYEDQAVEFLEKAAADLEPELCSAAVVRKRLATFAKAIKLAEFSVAALARKLDDVETVARATGSSQGKAKATVTTGKVMASSDDLHLAMQAGKLSLDQAAQIADAEVSAPGSARELVKVAQRDSFHVLKDKARQKKLDAEQHRDLGARQRAARYARSHSDGLGMVHVHLALEPHVGAPIVARAEAEAERLGKRARAKGVNEPFHCHLADAYTSLLSGAGKGRAKRPELVVLVSHQVAKRGWKDVRKGEVCKIPGIGPVPPQVARTIGTDAFLNALFFDGVDLRHHKRWSRTAPVEVRVALELGDPPDFDGVLCIDCGNRFRTEFDHVHPYAAKGPSSHPNLRPRCWNCHQEKTRQDRKAGRLKPPEP